MLNNCIIFKGLEYIEVYLAVNFELTGHLKPTFACFCRSLIFVYLQIR